MFFGTISSIIIPFHKEREERIVCKRKAVEGACQPLCILQCRNTCNGRQDKTLRPSKSYSVQFSIRINANQVLNLNDTCPPTNTLQVSNY